MVSRGPLVGAVSKVAPNRSQDRLQRWGGASPQPQRGTGPSGGGVAPG
jgi:hypothetical protein